REPEPTVVSCVFVAGLAENSAETLAVAGESRKIAGVACEITAAISGAVHPLLSTSGGLPGQITVSESGGTGFGGGAGGASPCKPFLYCTDSKSRGSIPVS